jgi:hypothetical protein
VARECAFVSIHFNPILSRNERPCAFAAVHLPYRLTAIKWPAAIRGQVSQSKAIANVETPPAQGVFGGISFLGGHHRRAAGTRPVQFRSSGR